MAAVHRLATLDDAGLLHAIRRRSILDLAPPRLASAEAQAWASQLTQPGMEQKLRELEIWVAELDGMVAGWGAIRGDYLEACTRRRNRPGRASGPDCSRCSKACSANGSSPSVRAEASSNALAFYLSRGYRANGPQVPNGAWPIAKLL